MLQETRLRAGPDRPRGPHLYAGYYPRRAAVDEAIEHVGLADKATPASRRSPAASSAGSTSRLALIGDPELLFLDEPTTGFDPGAPPAAWDVIGGLRDLGKTVFLTTHYMDEAQGSPTGWRSSRRQDRREGTPGRPDRPAPAGATAISFRLPPGVTVGELPVGDAPSPTARRRGV